MGTMEKTAAPANWMMTAAIRIEVTTIRRKMMYQKTSFLSTFDGIAILLKPQRRRLQNFWIRLKIGRYMETTSVPTSPPTPIRRTGSMTDRRAPTAASTSSS